jgi:hypothetical protein
MTLLSQISRQLLLPTQDYMDLLDYWTAFSIETHFKMLVKECKEINNTGLTETSKTSETSETSETDVSTPLD